MQTVEALTAPNTDELCLSAVTKTLSSTKPLEIFVHWVMDDEPRYIASLVAIGPVLSGQVTAAGWRAWRRPWDLEWTPDAQSLLNIPRDEPVLCAYRATTPYEVVREVSLILLHNLGAKESHPPKMRIITRPPGIEAPLAPEPSFHSTPSARRPGERQPSVTTCDECGQPLSDPESIAVGMGPECRRRYLLRTTGRALVNPDLVRLPSGAIVISAKGWRLKMRARLKVWIGRATAAERTRSAQIPPGKAGSRR